MKAIEQFIFEKHSVSAKIEQFGQFILSPEFLTLSLDMQKQVRQLFLKAWAYHSALDGVIKAEESEVLWSMGGGDQNG